MWQSGEREKKIIYKAYFYVSIFGSLSCSGHFFCVRARIAFDDDMKRRRDNFKNEKDNKSHSNCFKRQKICTLALCAHTHDTQKHGDSEKRRSFTMILIEQSLVSLWNENCCKNIALLKIERHCNMCMCVLLSRFVAVERWKSKLQFRTAYTQSAINANIPKLTINFIIMCIPLLRGAMCVSVYRCKSIDWAQHAQNTTKSSFDEILILIFSLGLLRMGLNGQCM